MTKHFQVQVHVSSRMPDLPLRFPIVEATSSVPTFTLTVEAETEFLAEVAGGNYVAEHFGGMYTVYRSRATPFSVTQERDLQNRLARRDEFDDGFGFDGDYDPMDD